MATYLHNVKYVDLLDHAECPVLWTGIARFKRFLYSGSSRGGRERMHVGCGVSVRY
ncbi:hypothetical protein KGY79_12415 [Candidatus Bipolaricaulota bacterium]|nr:hypothetical protein [Candidatus Bipolaricaulota bacterium]